MLKLKLILILSLLAFTKLLVHAQDTKGTKHKQLKIYYKGSFHESKEKEYFGTQGLAYVHESQVYDFGGISFALLIDKGKFFSHEFEVLPVLVKIDDFSTLVTSDNMYPQIAAGAKTTNLKTAFNYQFNHAFRKEGTLVPYAGFSTQFFGDYNKVDPAMSNYYPQTEMNIGFLFSLVPGLTINLGDKIGLDLNFPLGIFEIKYNWEYNGNPQIPVDNQKTAKIIGDAFSELYNVRLGLIYKI